MCELNRLIGLKIVAVKGYARKKNQKIHIKPEYILFEDQQTLLQLEEQDYHDYHDCASYARIVTLIQNKERWEQIMNNIYYKNATEDI